MIIANSNVRTASAGSYQKVTAQRTSMVDVASNSRLQLGISSFSVSKYDYLELGEEYMRTGKNAKNGENGPVGEFLQNNGGDDSAARQAVDVQQPEPSRAPTAPRFYSAMEMRLEMLRQMIAAMRGVRYFSRLFNSANGNAGITQLPLSAVQIQTRAFSIVREESVSESQSVSYSANGVVNTADGKTINFSVNMNMSRSTETHLRQELGFLQTQTVNKAVDPLIINYAGTAASLTGEKFDFDLDLDGMLDSISFAGEGGGFLALDKNGDGVINDGNELFGPQNGDGFAELRKYDSDGNGWIDEADEIYSKLRIWCKDKDGNDILFTLKDLDVGAIYLNESKTEFDVCDESDNVQGYMRSTSFFLKDSGGAGTISHMDLLA